MQDIPYAEPPVGNLRFSSPVPAPPAPTNCLLDATRTEDKICPQVNINFTLGSGLVKTDQESVEEVRNIKEEDFEAILNIIDLTILVKKDQKLY